MNSARKIGLGLLVAGVIWIVVLLVTGSPRDNVSYNTGRMLPPGLVAIAGLYLLVKGAAR